MFGALKRLFTKPAEPEQRSVPLSPTQLVKPAAPASTPAAPPAAPAKPAPAAAAAPVAPVAVSPPAAPTPSAAAPTPAADAGAMIHLPLSAIVAALPPNLSSLVAQPGSATFALPLKTALTQLATGAVKITFGELRQGSPPGSFADNATQDKTLISLPLQAVLASIDPAALGRRAGQRVTAVPESVTSVFGKMRPLSAATVASPAASSAGATEEEPPVAEAPPPPAPVAPPVPVPAPPEPGASPLTQRPATPVLPTSIPKPVSAIPSAPAAPKMPGVSPLPSALPKPPASAPLPSTVPKLPGVTPPGAAKSTAPSVMPFAAPKPPTMPTAAAPAVAAMPQESLEVPLAQSKDAWPAPVQEEIEKYQLGSASISIPAAKLEAAMKAGRVVFTWGELCGWLKPAPPENLTANREASLELPLKVIAPLFMARRQPTAPQKKITIAPQIPDLFAGTPKSPEAATAPAAPATSAAPVPAAAEPAAATAAAPLTASALAEIFGQPGKTEWSPQEITQQICALKGVAGSVLATSDGLLMSGQLPAPMRTETVAAFMPQIIGRVSQYAGEMQLGAVTGVMLAAGRGPCALYKTGKLYLAVLGFPGEALPEATLGRIAAELAKRNA